MFVVAQHSCASIDPLRLEMTVDSIINYLTLYEVVVLTACDDSATENVTFYNLSSSVKLGDFITPDTKAVFTKYDIKGAFEFEIAMRDEYTDHLILFLEDVPHIL